MKNRLIAGLSVIILALSGYMLYGSFNSGMSEAEVQSQFNDLKTDYEFLQNDLEKNVRELSAGNSLILAQKQKIEQIMRKSSITEEELTEAKKLMREISQSVLDEYKKRVSNLEKEKALLETDKVKNAEQLKVLDSKMNVLEKDKTTVTTKLVYEKKESQKKDNLLEQASKLSLSNFILKSFKVRSNGKEVETDKASRIERVKLNFDINENEIAESGTRDIFIAVHKPDGNLAMFKNKTSGTITANGKSIPYSDRISVDYIKGEQKTLDLVYDSDDFARGDYIIEIFEKKGNRVFNIGKVTKTLD